MKNIRSTGLKLFIPTVIALSLSACGGGGGGSSENIPAPAAPTLTFTNPQSTWDLANYTQTGSCALQVGTGTPNLLADEASAITYNKDTDSLFVVGDGATAVVEVNKNITGANCTTIGSMTVDDDDFADTEGITYVGGGKFVLVEERVRQADQFTYTQGGTLTRANVSTAVLGSTVTNVGIEGMSFDPMSNGYIAVRQSQPTSIFQATINFGAAGGTGTATGSDGAAITGATTNPPFLFDAAKTGLSAFNDVFALSNIVPTNAPDYGDVMIIGAPDGKIVKMDRTGKLMSSLPMSTTAQNEGMTMAPDGTIYVVGEQAAGANLPGMTVFTPTKNSSAVGIGSNLYLNFDQTVTAGSGNIVISDGAGDTRTIAVTDTSQVTFSGKTVKIDPKVFLNPGSTYSVTYDAGVIRGVSANAAAVSGTALSFTTVTGTADAVAPTLNSTAPVNSAAGISGSHFTLFFDEAVQAGTGNIVITNTGDASDTRTISITDTTQVKFNGGKVSIKLTTPLKDSASYSVQMDSGVVTDLTGNDAAGIAGGALTFTTAAAGAPAPTILITEVNSNATGGDFFELYNYGAAAVDLTGWKWGDSHGDVNDANNTAAFATGKTIAAGARLVVASVKPGDFAAFESAWGLTAGPNVISMLNVNNDAANPIGLGKGDAVIVYDANGNVASAFNFGPPLETSTGSGAFVSVPTSTGVSAIDQHAGKSVGGSATASAVWSGATNAGVPVPAYIPAVVGGVVIAQPGDPASVGSPGQ